MHDWISLNGVRSDTLAGVVVMAYTPPYLSPRKRDETVIPGHLTAIQQRDWQREPADIPITIAVIGADQAAVHAAWRNTVEPWLYAADRLTLDDAPEHYYLGAVTQVVQEEDQDQWIRLTITFRANPPVRLRLLTGQAGWFPSADTPIPQQLTDGTATAVKAFTGTGWMPEAALAGREAAQVYLAITGTWTTLQLGTTFDLHTAAAAETTVYIDTDNAQCWKLDGGVPVNLMGAVSGDMPALSASAKALQVGGENISVTVRMLVIDRG